MKNASTFIVGFIFALGLGISGMTDPNKVLGFLDLSKWDPSLMFVMIGAIGIHAIGYKLIRKRTSPLFSLEWHVPQKTKISRNLILGSLIFGIGWGLAGYCPGPAVTALASFQLRPLILVMGMIAGMYIFKTLDQKFDIRNKGD